MGFTGDQFDPAAALTDDDLVELELLHPDDLHPPSPARGRIPATVAAVVLHVWLLATFHTIILTDTVVLGIEPGEVIVTKTEDKKPDIEEEPDYTLARPNDK
ncbi:MAG: hypothetical protein ACE5KM_22855, partial [Planctomycetaceae bacterium]